MILMEKRIDLSEQLGIEDLAWRYEHILDVIKFCKDNELFICGGDVLSIDTDGRLDFTYDNWSTDGIDSADCLKAAEFSKNYINGYPDKEKYIFTIVTANTDE